MRSIQSAGKAIRWLAIAFGAATLAACGGGGNGGPNVSAAAGSLRIALTDAPRCRVGNDDLAQVNVTVERVRVHQSVDDEPRSGRWYDIEVSPARKINLLDLTNGRLEELGTTPLPAGTYSQVRLVLRANGGAVPANSVVLDGQTVEIPLRTPSAAQSGLKIIRPFTVAPNALVDLVIDFDACRSIVALGNGGFLLKPVLTAHLREVAAIAGYVDPLARDVVVSAQKGGRVVRSTIPAADGAFTLAFLDPANAPYDVVITSFARGTSVVAMVPVATNAITTLSTLAAPIPLPTAGATPTRTASGIVGPTGALDTGVVRALQAVGSVPAVEVGTTNVNPTTGAYTLTLPTATPLLAVYPTPPSLPLMFATPASPPADFSYVLEASAAGYVTQTRNIGTGTANATWDPVLVPVAP